MTKITLSSNASGTGNVNFAAPNTNSAITVTLPTANVDMDSLGPSTDYAAVGTYLIARATGSFTLNPGDLFSAATYNLFPANASGTDVGTAISSGSWRTMGLKPYTFSSGPGTTLFVRVS
jgi:uncharacterized protein YfaS (alpha-2-macroglobulin family)